MKNLGILSMVMLLTACQAGPAVDYDTVSKWEEKEVEVEAEVEVEEPTTYVNEKYSYELPLLEDFEIERLADWEGVKFMKWDKYEIEEDHEMITHDYKVEIGSRIVMNYKEYEELTEFVMGEYSGFTYEFVGDGVFVNEGVGEDSLKHYFVLEDGNIHELYLRILSRNYPLYEEIFNAFVGEFRLT
jgi:hypothetical protein